MAYIKKNTSGLINTRITDMGRQKMSQGNFKISYFQIGDSEVVYNKIPSYNQSDSYVLEPSFNSQNGTFAPETNKQNVKYPIFVSEISGATYGIPFMDSQIQSIYNAAPMKGFFVADTSVIPYDWSANTGSQYVLTSDYVIDLSTLDGTSNQVTLLFSGCNPYTVYTPQAGDFITIYFDGEGECDCNCKDLPTPTPTPTPLPNCPPQNPEDSQCNIYFDSCNPILTYRILEECELTLTLDRNLPNYQSLGVGGLTRVLVYPSNMTTIYDSETPQSHWSQDVFNFQTVCDIDQFDVNIWNMNIPWTENPAGLFPNLNLDFSNFGSVDYIGSKEFFGYNSSSGQTDSDSVYFYNSLGDKITVTPEEQKTIAIIHYTNNSIDFVYGEKFALEPYDILNSTNTLGFARNFKVHIPWIQWHKNPECCFGQTFYVDPEGFDSLKLFQVHYLTSNKNEDMNNPGHRYYHLWDSNPNPDGIPSRIGKVFPDLHTIVIDDEEIVAAMSYKSNRNWTLPAPRIALQAPTGSDAGVMTNNTEFMYVTYRFTNTTAFTNSLHCNYYVKIQGPNESCGVNDQNVSVIFGNEFNCLTGVTSFNKFEILCQRVEGDIRPDSTQWRIIDYTNQISDEFVNGNISMNSIASNTFIISSSDYDNALINYRLDDFITLPNIGQAEPTLNFGDEYFFYGNIETDIQATIYEMRYLCNLNQNQFQNSSNPTFEIGQSPYITEIGLYDSDKDLIVISKLQSPVLRTGVQQFLVKIDF